MAGTLRTHESPMEMRIQLTQEMQFFYDSQAQFIIMSLIACVLLQ